MVLRIKKNICGQAKKEDVTAGVLAAAYEWFMTDRKAYAYLKTLPIFEGAKDIVDEADTDISGDDFLAMVEEVM